MKKVVLPLVVWLGLWWALAVCVGQPLLLPTPWQTAARLGQLAVTAEFWTASLTTLGRVFLGGGSGIVIGVAAARWERGLTGAPPCCRQR